MADVYTNPVVAPSPSLNDMAAQSLARIQQVGLRVPGSAPIEEQQPTVRKAKVALDPTTNRLFIGGYVVDRNDDTNVALLSKYANQDAPLPEGNWEEVDPASFASYVQNIRDPSTLTLMAKNFGMGVDEMQQMAGLGLQWLGAESAGQYLADQEADLAPNQIYNRNFTDIGSSPENGILDWMAATIGRLGPNIVESTISAGAGAAIGGAVSGPAAPAAAPIGAIAGFFGKTAVKKALLEAAKKQLKGQALDAAEKKLLLSAAGLTNAAANASKTRFMGAAGVAGFINEGVQKGAGIVGGQVARRAAQAGGAAGLSLASNVFQQTGQAYGETMADGSAGDRGVALGVGILGGLADTIPEFILAGRLFSEAAGDVVGAAKKQKSAMDLLKGMAQGRTGKAATGAVGGAAMEGSTEAFQELLQIAANPTIDWNSPEAATRIVNSFAAGALMGGGFGAAGNAFAGSLSDNKKEADLLLPVSQSDPNFAQYREDLKARLGKNGAKEVEKLYGPEMGKAPLARDVVSPLGPDYLAGRQAQQDAFSPVVGLRQFAGQPQVPLSQGTEANFTPAATPDMPSVTGPVTQIPGMSGVATGSLPQGVQPTVYPGQPLPAGPGMSIGEQVAPPQPAGPLPAGPGMSMEQFQQVAQQQLQQAQQGPSVPPVQDLRGAGIPQPAPAAGPPLPGGQSINARLLQMGQANRATPPAQQQGTIRQAVEQGPMRMAGPATAQMVPTVTGQVTDTNLPNFSASRLKRGAAPTGAYQSGLAFLSELATRGQTSFTIEELGAFIFPKGEKLNALRRNQVEAVLNRLKEVRLVTEQPTGVYNVAGATPAAAANPGAGTASAGDAGPISGDGPDRQPAPGGSAGSGKTGKGDRLRNRKPTATRKPAPTREAQGPAARPDTVQEADNQPAVVTPAPAPEPEPTPAPEPEAKKVEVKKRTSPGGVTDYLVTLPDGRKATIYKDGDTWRIDHPGTRAFAQSQVGYASDALGSTLAEAKDNVAAALDRMEAAMAAKAAQETRKPLVVETLKKRTRNKPTTAKEDALKQGKPPENPKGEGAAATPSQNRAKAEPKLTERETWDETFDDKGVGYDKLTGEGKAAWSALVARDGGFTVAEAESIQSKYTQQTPKDLALKVRDEANKLIKIGLDSENLPAPESDLDDVYYAVARVRTTDGADFSAALSHLVSFLGSENSLAAREATRAYLDEHIDEVDVTVAKARLAAQNKKAMAADKAKAVAKAMEEESKKGRNMLSQYNSVENAVDEDGRPLKPIDKIKFKAIVDNFKRGLVRAPNIYTYKNQADLRTKNPSLYQKAVAARPQGDFDSAPAAGYSFGEDTVIIFSDRIATPKMLRLVLAHEAIGHFGLRSLLPIKQFNALMEYVYENSPLARQIADAESDRSGMDRLEAVEEYLAQYASYLDTSMVGRIFNAIKNVLNKLGITFEDDMARYLVSHARRYTREGATFFQADKFALDVNRIEHNMIGSGRFSIPTLLPWQRELTHTLHMADAMPSSLDDAKAWLSDAGINSSQGFDQFVRKFFRLGNYDALRNHGASAYEVLVNAVRTNVAALRNQYNEIFSDVMGLNQDSREALSYALYVGRSVAHQRLKFTPETRSLSLVKLDTDPETGVETVVANDEAITKFLEMGTLTKEELDNGVTVKVKVPTEFAGKYREEEVKIEGVNKLLGRDLTDDEYDYYTKSRRRLADIEIELLKARYDNFIATEKISIAGVRKILSDDKLTESDMKFVKDIISHSKVLISNSVEYDAQGLPTVTAKGLDFSNQYVAKVNEAIIKNEEKFDAKLEDEIRGFYKNKSQADAAIEAIKKFRERRRAISKELGTDVVYTVQNRLKEIVLADQMFEKAQAHARRSIAGGYVPVFREGNWQLRVEAQIGGKPATIHPEYQNKLILTLYSNRADAERGALALNEKMKDQEFEVLVRNDDGTYTMQKVNLFARTSKTVNDVGADPSLDIDNFIHGMRMFGLATNPDAMEKIIISLTNPGDALRKALRFDDTPGYDMKEAVTAMSRHIVTRASLIAKTRYQPAMRDLLDKTSNRGKLWYGDKDAVIFAKDKFDAATSDAERAYWADKLRTDLYKYRMTNPGAKDWDGSRDTFPNQPTSAELGNQFYNEAIAKQVWMEDSPNIAESTFEGKRYPAMIKAVTSVAFLGGSFAQFAQNLISPVTNVIPYLASKNSRTGFGGGFGVTAAAMEYNRAFKDVVGLRGLKPFSRVQDESGEYSFRIGDARNDAQFYFDIAKEFEAARVAKDTAEEARLRSKHRLSYYEALNIGREIREGKLIPAQSNAILETSRGLYAGSKLGRAWMKFTDVYMVPFNVSEQAARRASFLAAYRLEFNRLRQAGLEEAQANEQARAFAVETVDLTLGEYSNTNRPPAWREGWQSMLYMYKTYPTTAVLLFKNLSRGGKLGMLLGLMLLTGITGFPFAEDVEDLIDTLAQKFGFPSGPSLRKQLAETLDEIAPGLAPYILKGVANQFLPMDVASKTGIGNIIPGTGFLLAGADPAHELAEVGGPLVGMSVNIAKSTYDMLRAPFSERATFLDSMRNSPVSLVRSVGDVATYLQNGAIVDKRGYVVSPEVTAGSVLTRLLGFYPVEAANQYEFIKYARRSADFQRSVSVGFRDAWIKAMMSGDTEQAQRIVQEVNDWNEANPKARFNNWMKNTLRAYKEARRPAAERFLKTTPKASRESLARYMDAMLE